MQGRQIAVMANSPRSSIGSRKLPPRPSRVNEGGGLSRDQLVAQLKNLVTEETETGSGQNGKETTKSIMKPKAQRTVSVERSGDRKVRRQSMPSMGVGIKHISPPGRDNSPSPPDNVIKPRSRIPTPTGSTTSGKTAPANLGSRRNSIGASKSSELRRSSSAVGPTRTIPKKEETQKREVNSDPESNPITHQTGNDSADESVGSYSNYPRKASVIYRGHSALPPHMLLAASKAESASHKRSTQDEADGVPNIGDDTINNDHSFPLDHTSEINPSKTETTPNQTRYTTAQAEIVTEAYSIIGKYFPEKRFNLHKLMHPTKPAPVQTQFNPQSPAMFPAPNCNPNSYYTQYCGSPSSSYGYPNSRPNTVSYPKVYPRYPTQAFNPGPRFIPVSNIPFCRPFQAYNTRVVAHSSFVHLPSYPQF